MFLSINFTIQIIIISCNLDQTMITTKNVAGF